MTTMPSNTSTEFAGIRNENEFYSHHYLSELFVGDIRKTVKRLERGGGRRPRKASASQAASGLEQEIPLVPEPV